MASVVVFCIILLLHIRTMILNLLKYSILTIIAYHNNIKLFNKKPKLYDLFFVLAIAFGTVLLYFITLNLQIFLPLCSTIFLLLLSKLRLKNNWFHNITMSIISYGLSIFLYIISSIITLPILVSLFFIKNEFLKNLFAHIIIGFIQFFLSYKLFKLKRFKNGIQPDKHNKFFELLLFASLASIFVMSLFYTDSAQENQPEILIVFVILCGIILFHFWRKYITNKYLELVRRRNVEMLEQNVLSFEQENNELRMQNEVLSSIIHRDNKLVRAMLMTVESVAATNASADTEALLAHLRELAKERQEFIVDYQAENEKPPASGDPVLDGVLQLLRKKAKAQGAKLSFECFGSFCDLKDRIDKTDMSTLICDLGENALIAVRGQDDGEVFLSLHFESEDPRLDFYDNGPYFDKAVLAGLGRRRITTHKNEGGSGEGLFAALGICRKYQASFLLNERLDEPRFTKRVTIRFDGLHNQELLAND